MTKKLRSTTPPAVNTISVSEFVRGGLYSLERPTVVMSHSAELGTWYPRGQGVTTNYYGAAGTVPPDSTQTFSILRSSTAPSPGVDLEGIRTAVAKLHEYLGLPEQAAKKEEKDG